METQAIHDWCAGEREHSRRVAEALRSGGMKTGARTGEAPWVDTSQEELVRHERIIKYMDRLLARMDADQPA